MEEEGHKGIARKRLPEASVEETAKTSRRSEEAKRRRLYDAPFDHDPQLPGDEGVAEAINARLWSEARGTTVGVAESKLPNRSCRIEGAEPTNSKAEYCKRKANMLGMQSDESDGRVQGALNEPGIKFKQGIA